jgi:predicted nuclease of predicted toxin-antitoxin system
MGDFFKASGWSSVHWSTVGDIRALDTTIMAWALQEKHSVFTHDLDFGTLLALTHAAGPSVVQIRTPRVLPEHIGTIVLAAFNQYEQELAAGALITIELMKCRVRILPL